MDDEGSKLLCHVVWGKRSYSCPLLLPLQGIVFDEQLTKDCRDLLRQMVPIEADYEWREKYLDKIENLVQQAAVRLYKKLLKAKKLPQGLHPKKVRRRNEGSDYTLMELKVAEAEDQKEIMRRWFFSNFEDPAERTPYESREGGYIYIWGGPYDAEEVLNDEFSEYVPEKVIREIVKELESQCIEWTSAPSSEDYDDYYSSVILSNTFFHKTFLDNMAKIKALLDTEVDAALRQNYLRLIYVNVITTLETFLSDAFINTVLNKYSLIRKFVETNPDFAKQKFSLSELFEKADNIEDEVRNYLLSQIWHNIEKVRPMYESALDIKFPKDLKNIFKSIIIRHDIVHRNGKTKKGDEMLLTNADVNDLMEEVLLLVNYIDNQFVSKDEGDI